MIKFVVCPGYIYSDNGGRYYISAKKLIQLYKVNRPECIIINRVNDFYKFRGINTENIIGLFPRLDGDYKIAYCNKLQNRFLLFQNKEFIRRMNENR